MGVEAEYDDRDQLSALTVGEVRFLPVGRMVWGKEPYVSGGADITAWECQRCFTLVAQPVKHAERVRCFG